jgi:IS30 family transposase
MSQEKYITEKRSYCHIQESERKSIERMKRQGASNNQIAKALCRHRSSIGRELKRNSVTQRETVQTNSKSIDIPLFKEVKRYFWDSAQRQYKERRLRTGAKCKLASCSDFIRYLERKVLGAEKWSLDATRGYAERHGLFSVIPSTRTLYHWVDAGLLKIRNIDLLLKVRRKCKKKPKERKRILGRSIDERPDSINQRKEFGHWEGDGIIGGGRKGHLLTLAERMTGYGIVWDAEDRDAGRVVKLLDLLERQYDHLFPAVFKSITFDNGPEFSAVEQIEDNGRLTAYYAHPYSSYERGTSENWNGIVRRFIPKGMSLTDLDPDTLIRINRYINQLPRKRFGYRTPEELFEQKLQDIIKAANNPRHCSTCCT